jgi:hypothetical protein
MFLKQITYDEKGVLAISANTGDGEATFKTESPHNYLSNLFDNLSNAVAAWLMPEANTFGLEGISVTRDKNGIHSAVIAYAFTSKRHPLKIQRSKIKSVVLLEQRVQDGLLASEHFAAEEMADLFNAIITQIEELSEWASNNWLAIEHRVDNQLSMFDDRHLLPVNELMDAVDKVLERGTKASNE